jgi:hypothetical protein
MKFAFMPLSIGGGFVAGMLAKKLFDQLWGLVDDEEPPDSEHRDISWGKLIAAAALQGAILRAVRVATDHGARIAFANVTGSWPGEEHPEPE